MSNSKTIHLLGYASGIAGIDPESSEGPLVMQDSPFLSELIEQGINLKWEEILLLQEPSNASKLEKVASHCQKFASQVYQVAAKKNFFTVIGGDHTSAIATWSGVYHAVKNKGPFGLIWIDAHMDSHTPHTSLSGNIHGMPLACLLGYGMPSLTKILDDEPKLRPENLCLIGVRSFERGEAALLKELNVRVFFIEEVKERGLDAVMKEALEIVTKGTSHYGISIDLDSIDPMDAPGTEVPEPNGIAADELCKALQMVADDPRLIGLEIAEFDPRFDQDRKTEKLVANLIGTIALGKQYKVMPIEAESVRG